MIRREMRRRARATCPELTEATGLSAVTVHREVAQLCAQGELRESEAAESRGGRRARVYVYEARYAQRAYMELRQEGAVTRVRLEITDLLGHLLSHSESTYAALETESLDGRLDTALRRARTAGIALHFMPRRGEAEEQIRQHLQLRYGCPVVCVCPAEALADAQDDTATLYLPRGAAPRCSMRRSGRAESAGRLDLLPLPCSWERLDYSDHTLVEEMVARLLQIISCTLAPGRIVLHADFWTTRLTERIRFNTASKLHGSAPRLSFRPCSAELALAAARALAQRL